MVPLLVPLFVSAFRRAGDLAMAMEARCYRGGEGRTRLRVLQIHQERPVRLLASWRRLWALIVLEGPAWYRGASLCTVEYDGTDYAGWQRQVNGLAVQQVLEEALARATRRAGRASPAPAARTRAFTPCGQAFHFDTDSSIPPEKYPFVLNTMLPRDIRVHTGQEVPAEFHARFMTAGKRYTYRICNSRHGTALGRNLSAHVPLPLEESLMQSAAQTLLDTHDFAAFQASGGTAKTTVRTMRMAEVTRQGDDLTLVVEGDAFLYNMVRIIAGTLIEIGLRRRGTDAFLRAFDTMDRLALGVTAPACGLELTKVYYPEAALRTPEIVRWHED